MTRIHGFRPAARGGDGGEARDDGWNDQSGPLAGAASNQLDLPGAPTDPLATGAVATAAPAAATVTGAAAAVTGLVFNVTFDASVANAPAGFVAAFDDAIQFYEANFSDPITINLDVGWGEIAGFRLSAGSLGESETNQPAPFTYTEVRSALAADAKSGADQTALANLPTTDPTHGRPFSMSNAEAKALGLMAPDTSSIDGWVGFGSGVSYTFDPNDRSVSGKYDFIGVAEHEISEVMGRASIAQNGREFSPIDLFRYTAPGDPALIPVANSYFSIDGGDTRINTFNNRSGGDLTDWSGATADSYNAFVSSGHEEDVTAGDLTEMDALGYDTVVRPATPANLALAPASDSGRAGDDITNIAAPSITGSGVFGDSVTLFDGTVAVGSTTVGASGTWSVTTAPLAAGSHSITATQTDPDGVASAASAPLTVTIKVSAPAPSAPGLPGGGIQTATPTPTLVGTGEVGDTVTVFDGSRSVATAVVGPSGSWSATSAALPKGQNLLTATETDIAGNISTASPAFSLLVLGNVFGGEYPNGLILSNPQTQGTATIATSGYVGNNGVALRGDPSFPWVVANYGTVVGTGNDGIGVVLGAGGTVTNKGLIAGSYNGIDIAGAYGAVVNYGTVSSAGGGDAVYFGSYGAVTNYGMIVGGTGVDLAAGGAVSDAGTIIGNNGIAVELAGPQTLLTLVPGAVIAGAAVGDGASTLDLAAGSGSLVGGEFTGFAAVIVEAGAVWQIDAAIADDPGLDNNGALIVGDGATAVLGAVAQDGGQHGFIYVGGDAAAEFAATVMMPQRVVFTDGTGTLRLDRPAGFHALIMGITAGDTIDLVDKSANRLVFANGVLTLREGGTPVAHLRFAGHHSAADFTLSGDGNGGTDITLRTANPLHAVAVGAGGEVTGLSQPVAAGDLFQHSG